MQYRVLRDGVRELHVSSLCLGTMNFGTTTPQDTSFAIMDAFAEAGGTLLDTANCYAFWNDGGTGEESERVIGAWLRDRGARRDVQIATKVGAAPGDPTVPYSAHNREGLSATTVKTSVYTSLERLGTDHVELLYAHADDRFTALEETLSAFAELVDEGVVGMVAASNHSAWRFAQARDTARAAGTPVYCAVQQNHTLVDPEPARGPLTDMIQLTVNEDLADYLRAHPDVTLFSYSPLGGGVYGRTDRQLRTAPVNYDHPDARAQLATVRQVAQELDVPANQLVLAWLMGNDIPSVPVVGVSSTAQLAECLGALDLTLDQETRARLTRVA